MSLGIQFVQQIIELSTSAVELAENGNRTAKALDGASRTVINLFKRPEKGSDPAMEIAISELATKIAETYAANMELKLAVTTLKSELLQAQAASDEFKRYVRHATPAGHIVRILREDRADGEPAHYVCPVCFSKRAIYELKGNEATKRCPECKEEFWFTAPEPASPGAHADRFRELGRRLNK